MPTTAKRMLEAANAAAPRITADQARDGGLKDWTG